MTTQTVERRTVIRTPWGFFANSVIASTLAIVLSRLLEQFGVAIGGLFAHREPYLTNVAAHFRAPGSDLPYLAGTVTALLAGVVFLYLYPSAKDRSPGKLMVLWMSLHCFRIAFTDLIMLRFSETSNLAKALAPYDLPAGLSTVLAAAGAVGLILVAVAAAPAFLGFTRHRSEVATKFERLRYAATIALIPGIVSPLLAVPFFLSTTDGDFLRTLPLVGLFTLITVAVAPTTVNFTLPQTVEERQLSLGLVIATLVVFLLARFLEPGLVLPPWDANLDIHLRP